MFASVSVLVFQRDVSDEPSYISHLVIRFSASSGGKGPSSISSSAMRAGSKPGLTRGQDTIRRLKGRSDIATYAFWQYAICLNAMDPSAIVMRRVQR